MHETREFPTRPIVGIGAVIWKGEQVLLVRQSEPPRDKIWGLPGGAQELGESLEEAVYREVKEETGLDITISGLIDTVDAIIEEGDGRIRFHYTLLDYRCEWASGDAKADSDVEELQWVTLEELVDLEMWPETRDMIFRSAKMAQG